MSTARHAIYHGPGREFELAERPLPPCGPGELLVAVSLATICGSDLHTVDGRRTTPTPGVLGHEGVGRVVAVGPGRDAAWLDARVTWTLADSCGACAPCREWDLPQKCAHLFKYGHAALADGAGLNGCYATHIMLRAGTTVIRVPEALADEVVAPANCALATMVGATESLPVRCRVAVVQGAGLLGLYGCALLRAQGVPRVLVVDRNPERLRWVTALGGEPVLDSALGLLGPGGADAVWEVTGAPAVVAEGLRLLRPGGYYAWLGMVHPDSALALTGESIIRGCLTVRGLHNYAPRHLAGAVDFLSRTDGRLPWRELAGPVFGLGELPAALAAARTQRWARVGIRPGVAQMLPK